MNKLVTVSVIFLYLRQYWHLATERQVVISLHTNRVLLGSSAASCMQQVYGSYLLLYFLNSLSSVTIFNPTSFITSSCSIFTPYRPLVLLACTKKFKKSDLNLKKSDLSQKFWFKQKNLIVKSWFFSTLFRCSLCSLVTLLTLTLWTRVLHLCRCVPNIYFPTVKITLQTSPRNFSRLVGWSLTSLLELQ